MNFRRQAVAVLIAAALAGAAPLARADDAAALTGEIQTMDASATTKGTGAVTGKIAADFQTFAGSKENSTALVTGLRNGSEITLTQPGKPSATFTPATRPMGYGNVSTSLALARYQLAQQGITSPTPEQLKTALNGGTITYNGKTVAYNGITQMRADGLGWGQIAQQVGTKLGPVVSGMKAQNAHIATLPAAKPLPATTATGATTAAGAAAANGQAGSGSKGIVTGSGASAQGAAASGGAKGKGAEGVTTAGGGASAPRGQGIVTASGQGASPVANGAAAGRGGAVTTGSGAAAGAGPGNGNGKAVGLAK